MKRPVALLCAFGLAALLALVSTSPPVHGAPASRSGHRVRAAAFSDFYLVLMASSIDPNFEGFVELEIFPETLTFRGFRGTLWFADSQFPVVGRISGTRVRLTGFLDGVRFNALLIRSATDQTLTGTFGLSGALVDRGTFTASTLLYVDTAAKGQARSAERGRLLPLRRR